MDFVLFIVGAAVILGALYLFFPSFRKKADAVKDVVEQKVDDLKKD